MKKIKSVHYPAKFTLSIRSILTDTGDKPTSTKLLGIWCEKCLMELKGDRVKKHVEKFYPQTIPMNINLSEIVYKEDDENKFFIDNKLCNG